jgi:hypothetical protein
MNLLQLDLNTLEIKRRLGDLGENFRVGSSRLKIIGARAINRNLKHMLTHISRGVRKIYYVGKPDFDAAVTLVKASPKKTMRGKLLFNDRMSLPLVHFGAHQRKTFVSVKVLRANRARRIQPGGKHKILATERKGRAAVWIAKGQVLARVEDSETPVMLWGPSFMAFFRKPGIAEQLREESARHLNERLIAETKYMLSGRGLKNYGRK